MKSKYVLLFVFVISIVTIRLWSLNNEDEAKNQNQEVVENPIENEKEIGEQGGKPEDSQTEDKKPKEKTQPLKMEKSESPIAFAKLDDDTFIKTEMEGDNILFLSAHGIQRVKTEGGVIDLEFSIDGKIFASLDKNMIRVWSVKIRQGSLVIDKRCIIVLRPVVEPSDQDKLFITTDGVLVFLKKKENSDGYKIRKFNSQTGAELKEKEE